MNFLKRNIHFFSCLLIIIIGTIIYSNTFNGEFQFDDSIHIVNENELNKLSEYTDFSLWTNVNGRPLAYFSLALNKSINGIDVFGYHLFNLIVHLFTSIIVYYLTLLLVSQPIIQNDRIKGKEHLISLFVGLLFLCHPIQTQAVSYIIQRMTSLAGLFYISSILFYFKARISQVESQKYKPYFFYLMMTITAISSVLSKQIAVTLPLMYLLIEFFFIRNKSGKRFNKLILFGLVTLIVSLLIVIIGGYLPRESEEIGRGEYFVTQLRVIVKYFQLLILPISQNVDYDFPLSVTLWRARELMSLFFILGLLISIFVSYKRHPLISFGLSFIFISLSVESSFIPIRDVIFEHRLYLPMFGFALVIISIIIELFRFVKYKYWKTFLMFVIIVASLATYQRNKVWATKFSLWYDVVQKSPEKYRPHHNLGNAYLLLFKPELAMEQFKIAKNLQPDVLNEYSYLNLGITYLDLLKPNLAIEQFNIAIQNTPYDGQVYYFRGLAYLMSGNSEDALQDLNQSILYDNNFADAYNSRGKINLGIKNFDAAFADFTKAIDLEPNLISAWFNRSNVSLFNNDIETSLSDLDQLILIDSTYAPAYSNRGQIKLNLNSVDDAIKDLNRAIKLDPDLESAYNIRARAYYSSGQFDLAIHDLNQSLKFDPSKGLLMKVRGICYLNTQQIRLAYLDFLMAKELGVAVEIELIEHCERELIIK